MIQFSIFPSGVWVRGYLRSVFVSSRIRPGKNLARKYLERWNAAVSVDEGTNITSANQRSSQTNDNATPNAKTFWPSDDFLVRYFRDAFSDRKQIYSRT